MATANERQAASFFLQPSQVAFLCPSSISHHCHWHGQRDREAGRPLLSPPLHFSRPVTAAFLPLSLTVGCHPLAGTSGMAQCHYPEARKGRHGVGRQAYLHCPPCIFLLHRSYLPLLLIFCFRQFPFPSPFLTYFSSARPSRLPPPPFFRALHRRFLSPPNTRHASHANASPRPSLSSGGHTRQVQIGDRGTAFF